MPDKPRRARHWITGSEARRKNHLFSLLAGLEQRPTLNEGAGSVVSGETLALALGFETWVRVLRGTGPIRHRFDTATETKDRVARWLRDELKKARNGVPRIEIADAAMTMIESCQPPDGPGADLLGLLRELLEVDVHRAKFAASGGELEYCAVIEAHAERDGEGRLSDGELARRCGANRVTVLKWRRLPRYQSYLEEARAVCTEPKAEG